MLPPLRIILLQHGKGESIIVEPASVPRYLDMAAYRLERLPVVDSQKGMHLNCIISCSDILKTSEDVIAEEIGPEQMRKVVCLGKLFGCHA